MRGRRNNMNCQNLHIFAVLYQALRNKSHIDIRFLNFFLCGFLFLLTFAVIVSVFSLQLTESSDTANNLNSITSLKSQRATATPCTTRTLKASRSFADEQTIKDVRKLESKGCAGNTEKYLRFLNLNWKSFCFKVHFEGDTLLTLRLIKTGILRDARIGLVCLIDKDKI